jgi:hypothetical protein
LRTLRTALLLTLAPVACALALAPGPKPDPNAHYRVPPPSDWRAAAPASPGPVLTRYLRLSNWDSLHFFDIAAHGYLMPGGRPPTGDDVHSHRANVTFLPAYPLLVRAAMAIGVPGQIALPIAAQAMAVLAWVYFLLIARQLIGASERSALKSALILASYPGSFYLVAAYTESMYLALLLGLVYWTEKWIRRPGRLELAAIAALHGYVMTSTRMLALPAIAYPVFRVAAEAAFSPSGRFALRSALRAALRPSAAWAIALCSALGLGSFFLYCALRFGDPFLYFRLLELGWGQEERWFLFLFDPRSYLPWFFFEETVGSLNRLGVTVTVFLLAVLLIKPRKPLSFALAAASVPLLYLTLVGKAASGMDGMIRYSMPLFALLVLGCLADPLRVPGWIRNHAPVRAFLVAFALAAQLWLFRRYLYGAWVS